MNDTYELFSDEIVITLTSWVEFYNMVSKAKFDDFAIQKAVLHYLPTLKNNIAKSQEIPLSAVKVDIRKFHNAVIELIDYYAEAKKELK